MKAIITRYHGPTNHKGARISAEAEGVPRIYISYPHELSDEACFRKAAEVLCEKHGWPLELIAGGTRDGFVFVFTENLNGGAH